MLKVLVFALLFNLSFTQLPPLLITFGTATSNIFVQVNTPNPINPGCPTVANFTVSFDCSGLNQQIIECLPYWLQIATDGTSTPSGVTVSVPDYKGSITDLLPQPLAKSPLIQSLLSKGYVWGKTLFGIGSDWRKAPSYTLYALSFRITVENIAALNRGSKVTILAEGRGTFLAHYSMAYMTDPWKQNYINSFISFSPDVGGNPADVAYILSGYDVCSSTFDSDWIQSQRGWTHWFPTMANPDIYGSQVLISTPRRNFTSTQVTNVFTLASRPEAINFYTSLYAKDFLLSGPNVPVVCLIGNGNYTIVGAAYADSKFASPPSPLYDDGDSMRDSKSTNACDVWSQSQGYPVKVSVKTGLDYWSWWGLSENVNSNNEAVSMVIDSIMASPR